MTLTFDGRDPVSVNLGAASLTPPGQVVTFPARTFTKLRVTITRVVVADPSTPVTSRSSVGFAEVEIPGVTATEVISMPQDLLRAAGPSSIGDRLSLIMTRLRSSGTPPFYDTETTLNRAFWLPTARTFSLTGSATISPLIPDDMIDRLVGRPGSDGTGIVAYSLGRLPGDLRAGAIATLDDNSSTMWEPGFGSTHQAGDWLQYRLPSPITFDHLDLQIVADGQHSVPTSLTVTAGDQSAKVTLPPLADGTVPGSVVDVPVSFPAMTGADIQITVDSVRFENTLNYYSEEPIAMPIGIAEVGIPGLHASPVPADIPSSCLGDLLTLDGNPLWVTVTGSTTTALNRQALTVSLCGPDAGGVALGPGQHSLESTAGQTTGFDIDQLAFDSAPGGGPMPLQSPTTLAPPSVSPAPVVDVGSKTSTSIHLSVHGLSTAADQAPIFLVLGESINAGWKASVVGGGSLGAPTLIDGFANGWLLHPAALGGAVHNGTLSVVLTWEPQKRVDLALIVSLVAIIACIVLALVPGCADGVGGRGRHSRSGRVRCGRVGRIRVGRIRSAGTLAVQRNPAAAGQRAAPVPGGASLVMPFGAESPGPRCG